MPEPTRALQILPTAATMAGVCLTVISIVKLNPSPMVSVIDDVLAWDSLAFLASCLLSYLSIRRSGPLSDRLEQAADVMFLAGLTAMVAAAFMFVITIT